MEKEEILEKSRKENKKTDFYEAEVDLKATRIAAVVALILAFMYDFYENLIRQGNNSGYYSIVTAFVAVMFGYKAIKLKKGRITCVICSVICGIITIVRILRFFKVI